MQTPWLAAIAILSFPLLGCGVSTSVSGSVTYDGKPVENGAITFLPIDGRGPTTGGPILAGRYRIDGILPGTKLVQIVGVESIPFARTTAELAQKAEEAAQRGEPAAPNKPATMIPGDAEGNNAKVEIKPGDQTLDFQLVGLVGG